MFLTEGDGFLCADLLSLEMRRMMCEELGPSMALSSPFAVPADVVGAGTQECGLENYLGVTHVAQARRKKEKAMT